jgi:endonuclease-3
MDKRIKRHMEKKKKIFWHIDYLTSQKNFKPYEAYIINDAKKVECRKAAEIQKSMPSIPGFGSSDCSCSSHLFYAGRKEKGLEALRKLLFKVGFDKHCIEKDRSNNYK